MRNGRDIRGNIRIIDHNVKKIDLTLFMDPIYAAHDRCYDLAGGFFDGPVFTLGACYLQCL